MRAPLVLIVAALLLFALTNVAATSRASTRQLRTTADDDGFHAGAWPEATCRWTFLRYNPSPVERRWRDNIAFNQRNVCNATKELKGDTRLWLQYSRGTWGMEVRTFN